MRRFTSLAALLLVFICSRSVSGQSTRATSVDTKRTAAAAFDEGQTAQQRGDLNSAVKLYSTAISADPSLYQAYYQRATAELGLGREADAETDLRKVNELEPRFARSHRALGRLLLDKGKTDEAKRELARAVELEPTLTGLRIYLASALIKSSEPERAIEHLRAAIEQNEETPLAWALLGVAEERLNKPTEAFAAYSRAIELDAANGTAHEGRGRIYESRADLAKAIEDYSAAYLVQPSRDAAIKLAELHTRAGQPQAAIQLYRRLLLEKPDDLAVRVEMARLLADNGQAEEAEKEILLVVAAKPTDPGLLTKAGDFFFKKKPELASEYYKRALASDSKDNYPRVQLGAALVRSMQFEAAIPVLNDALAREPGNYAAHASLATALFKLKHYPDSAREFIWIIRARPEVSASYFFLAICVDHLGDCEQAYKAYQEYVRRADAATNKNEVEEATTRSAALKRLIGEGKCKSTPKKKGK